MATSTVPDRRSPSSAAVAARHKVTYWLSLLRESWGRARDEEAFVTLLADLREYDEVLAAHGAPPLRRSRVLEIGYGARPHRQRALQSLAATSPGMSVTGVDTEAPMIEASIAGYRRMWRENGPERTAKSLVRHLLFDAAEHRTFTRVLSREGIAERFDSGTLLVADASRLALPEGSVDVILSEDVFEHIPEPSLHELCRRMATLLAPGGLALIRPNVFTGITGGHRLDWNRRSFTTPRPERRTPPWGHLLGTAPPVNTYLNELRRAEFRSLFAEHLEIVDERVKLPDLGRELLTPELADQLAPWGDDELFSNQVLFVLRRRGDPTPRGSATA